MEAQEIESGAKPAKYHSVNSMWPEGTNDGRDIKPTPQEAIAACRRLYRFAMKRPFRGRVELTSGNRHTWIRRHVLYVNPDETRWPGASGGGWHEIVHSMSHLCCARLFPKAKGHGPQHAFLEREMIEHVVKSGWLDGKLRRPEKPAPTKADKTAAKDAAIEASIKRWETKRKRAETALKKLRKKRARLTKAASRENVRGVADGFSPVTSLAG